MPERRLRLIRFLGWWNLPRIFGFAAAALGLAHYLPLPYLSIPSLIKLHSDIAPELIGIGLTLVLIDWTIERRQEKERKSQLIRQLGSSHRDVTEMAIIELSHKGWLQDGSLSGVYLCGANLGRAALRGANLSRVNFWGADLRGAILIEADLSRADLWNTNLSGAVLTAANLSRVKGWTIEQLEQVGVLDGTIMPDDSQLGGCVPACWSDLYIGGPTFDEWKAQYLAKYGGTVTDIRHSLEVPNTTADKVTESGAPDTP